MFGCKVLIYLPPKSRYEKLLAKDRPIIMISSLTTTLTVFLVFFLLKCMSILKLLFLSHLRSSKASSQAYNLAINVIAGLL